MDRTAFRSTPRLAGPSLALLVAALSACTLFGGGRPAASPPPAPRHTGAVFSGARAFAHLEALSARGPRVAGTPGVAAARDYVRARLEAEGLEVDEVSAEVTPDGGEEGATFPLTNLRAVLPGASDDLLILAAPLDSAPAETFALTGANEGASGSALLLELARALREDPLPYTVWLEFLDGELFQEREYLGAAVLADRLRRDGDMDRLRLFVYFNQVGDRDLAISRDGRSHRLLRQTFFRTAARIGHGDAFPADRPYEMLPGGHRALLRSGFRRVLVVGDARYGGDEAPGAYWRTAEDTPERCSPESLEAVGQVTVASLHALAERMRKLDAVLAETPQADIPERTARATPEAGSESVAPDAEGGAATDDASPAEVPPADGMAPSPGDDPGAPGPGADDAAPASEDAEAGAAPDAPAPGGGFPAGEAAEEPAPVPGD
jgi:hypothetical protein